MSSHSYCFFFIYIFQAQPEFVFSQASWSCSLHGLSRSFSVCRLSRHFCSQAQLEFSVRMITWNFRFMSLTGLFFSHRLIRSFFVSFLFLLLLLFVVCFVLFCFLHRLGPSFPVCRHSLSFSPHRFSPTFSITGSAAVSLFRRLSLSFFCSKAQCEFFCSQAQPEFSWLSLSFPAYRLSPRFSVEGFSWVFLVKGSA